MLGYSPEDGDTGVADDGIAFNMIFDEGMDTSVNLNNTTTLEESGFALTIVRQDNMLQTEIDYQNALAYGDFSWTTTTVSNDTLTFTFKDNATLTGAGLNPIGSNIDYEIILWDLPTNLVDINDNSLDTGSGPDPTGAIFSTTGPS